MTFTEDGSNHSEFNNAADGKGNIETKAGAPRGLSFSVSYGDDSASSGIGFSTTDIVIDAGDEWSSGEEIGVTLTDSDANTNSLDADDLAVSNPDNVIPTITIGEPLTLTTGLSATIGGDLGSPSDVGDADYSQRQGIITAGTFTDDDTLIITIGGNLGGGEGITRVVNYDLSAFADAALTIGGEEDAQVTLTLQQAQQPVLPIQTPS